MKPKPYEAQNTKVSEYQRSLLISYATFDLLKFENRTKVIIKILRFLRHRRPGKNEGVFGTLYKLSKNFFILLLKFSISEY